MSPVQYRGLLRPSHPLPLTNFHSQEQLALHAHTPCILPPHPQHHIATHSISHRRQQVIPYTSGALNPLPAHLSPPHWHTRPCTNMRSFFYHFFIELVMFLAVSFSNFPLSFLSICVFSFASVSISTLHAPCLAHFPVHDLFTLSLQYLSSCSHITLAYEPMRDRVPSVRTDRHERENIATSDGHRARYNKVVQISSEHACSTETITVVGLLANVYRIAYNTWHTFSASLVGPEVLR